MLLEALQGTQILCSGLISRQELHPVASCPRRCLAIKCAMMLPLRRYSQTKALVLDTNVTPVPSSGATGQAVGLLLGKSRPFESPIRRLERFCKENKFAVFWDGSKSLSLFSLVILTPHVNHAF